MQTSATNESKVHLFDLVPKAGPGDKMIRKDCFLSVQLPLPVILPLIISSHSVRLLLPSQPLCLSFLVLLLLLSIRGSPAGLDETEGWSRQTASPCSQKGPDDKTEARQERPQTLLSRLKYSETAVGCGSLPLLYIAPHKSVK